MDTKRGQRRRERDPRGNCYTIEREGMQLKTPQKEAFMGGNPQFEFSFHFVLLFEFCFISFSFVLNGFSLFLFCLLLVLVRESNKQGVGWGFCV